MNIKRVTGVSEYDAMQKARSEFGDSAYILHTKKLKNSGFFSFLKKPKYEVIIGIDVKKEAEEDGKYDEIAKLKENQIKTKEQLDEIKEAILDMNKVIKTEMKKNDSFYNTPTDAVIVENKTSNLDDLDEFNYDKSVVTNGKKYSKHVKNVHSEYNDYATYSKSKIEKDDDKVAVDEVDELDELEVVKKLSEIGCTNEVIDNIKQLTRDKLKKNPVLDIEKTVKESIKDFAGEHYGIEKKTRKAKILFFVGPTGVGKTTTIAKIAAKLSVISGYDIAMITTDTFRIAAVDQLKAYANILSVPISVVYKGDELEETLETYQDCDFILVDTAGRNHRDADLKKYITSFLENVKNPDVFLLLNLGLSVRELEVIIDSYSFIDDYSLIYTKLDETVSRGNLLNIKAITDKSSAFITNGQSVPQDIMTASKKTVLDIITGEYDE